MRQTQNETLLVPLDHEEGLLAPLDHEETLLMPLDHEERLGRPSVHKTADFFCTSLSSPPHLRTLMGDFFLKARTDVSRHLAKKTRMLQFLGEPILFIINS